MLTFHFTLPDHSALMLRLSMSTLYSKIIESYNHPFLLQIWIFFMILHSENRLFKQQNSYFLKFFPKNAY